MKDFFTRNENRNKFLRENRINHRIGNPDRGSSSKYNGGKYFNISQLLLLCRLNPLTAAVCRLVDCSLHPSENRQIIEFPNCANRLPRK